MKNILVISSCNKLFKCLESYLDGVALLSKVKFVKNLHLKSAIYSAYDLTLIHFTEAYYAHAVKIVDDMTAKKNFNFIIVAEGFDEIKKEELLGLSPVLLVDFTYNKNTSIYNFRSYIESYKQDTQVNENNFPDSFNRFFVALKSNKIFNQDFKSLSNRETEVLYFILSGKNTKEISHIMGINQTTTSTLKGRLFQKLKVSSIVELVELAYTYKIVPLMNVKKSQQSIYA